MTALAIGLANLAALAGAVFGVVRAGRRPQVLLYAFVIDYGLRLLTIQALAGPGRSRASRALAGFLSSPPAAGQQSAPFTNEGTRRPIGFGGYLLVTAFLAVLTFVLSHVNASRELDVDLATFLNDARWAAALGAMYWLQSLASRTITIDAGATREINFGFNTRDLIVFAFAVLAAGLVVVIRQMNGLSPTGWTVLGPLLAFRFLFDLSLGLRHARERT